jgi:hypothetical protein
VAKLYNMAQMTVSGTPGTGTFTLSAATVADGITYKTLAQAGAVNGDIVSYRANDGAGWEVGRGTVGGAGTTLTRSVLLSSNANALINAGPATIVLISPLAEDFPPVPLTVPLGGTGATNFTVPTWTGAPGAPSGVMPLANATGAFIASNWAPLTGWLSSLIAYDAGSGSTWIEMGASGGTLAAPAATPISAILGGMYFSGYDGAGWRTSKAWVESYSTDTWSATARGAAVRIGGTISGTNTSTSVAVFSPAECLLQQTTRVYKAGLGDPFKIQTDSGLYCRAYYQGTRTWTAGVDGPSGGGWMLADETAAAVRMTVSTTGACSNTTGTWSAISDVRLKKDIAPYGRGLAAVLRLEPKSFKYNGRGVPDDGTTHYGLVADEVADIVPEVVGETNLAAGPDSEELIVKTVDPGRLIYALINSCKELAAQNAALSARIEALEAR